MKDAIKNAIGAHGMWKMRLRTAIDSGKTEVPVETIRKDNECAFGKWLYGTTIPAAEKNSDHYKKVKDLHAEFHKTAARVTELALGGKKSEADAMMGTTGAYTDISAKLTQMMMDWMSKIK